MLKNEPKIENIRFHGYDKLCHCRLKEGSDLASAREACGEALRTREEPRILCDRAEAYLAEDMFDEVSTFFDKAVENTKDINHLLHFRL